MFTKSNYLIKEQVAFLKLVDRYDIFDPETGSLVAYAKENISGLQKALRLVVKKTFLPTTIEIKSANGDVLQYVMKKKAAFIRSKVVITDASGNEIGYFRSRVFTIGGRFDVFKMDDTKIAEVKGKWTGWDFKFLDLSGKELGSVSKQWSGIGRELFTNADNYMIALSPSLQGNAQMMALMLMAGLAIDVVYKEQK
ncbi:MAG TPA: phospholipid scramblase-related protein [Bacteroidales bacterium]|nr:phospholipid scramblase-related protein [Bacteroidales bacterium]